jgi:hypothetical protein
MDWQAAGDWPDGAPRPDAGLPGLPDHYTA